jgi:hypothetical protein
MLQLYNGFRKVIKSLNIVAFIDHLLSKVPKIEEYIILLLPYAHSSVYLLQARSTFKKLYTFCLGSETFIGEVP